MKLPTIAIAAVFLVCASAHAAPQYAVSGVTLTDLGTLGGAEGVALDLNDSGEIVGWSTMGTAAAPRIWACCPQERTAMRTTSMNSDSSSDSVM